MAVSIRLRREGARNSPYYKVVVADSRSPRDGKFIEILGTYDPKKPDHNSTLKLDRIEHWISQGAQPSDTVRSLIKKNKNQAANADAEPVAAKETPEPAAAKASPEPAAEQASPEPAATQASSESAPAPAPAAPAEESASPAAAVPPPIPAAE